MCLNFGEQACACLFVISSVMNTFERAPSLFPRRETCLPSLFLSDIVNLDVFGPSSTKCVA